MLLFGYVQQQTGPAHIQRRLYLCRLAQGGIEPGTRFRPIGCETCHDFRQEHGQGTAIVQHPNEDIGALFEQGAGDFLPQPFGGQGIQLAAGNHLLHQQQRLGRHLKPQGAIAGGEAGHAQHTQGVFGEGRGDVAQQARLEIGAPAIGVYDMPLVILGHGVDGKVAADQILFEGDVGCGVKGEAAIAAPALAFGTGQGVLLTRLGMQEDRKVGPYRAKALGSEGLGGGTHHDPVHFGDRSAEQAIAYGAAYLVDLHRKRPPCGGLG